MKSGEQSRGLVKFSRDCSVNGRERMLALKKFRLHSQFGRGCTHLECKFRLECNGVAEIEKGLRVFDVKS